MNESHTSSEISDEVDALRQQVFILLLALTVISCTLVAYLCYQSHVTSKNYDDIRPQATKLIEGFNHDAPAIQSFVKQLAAYGQKNPDFQQQVLKKYGITNQPASTPQK